METLIKAYFAQGMEKTILQDNFVSYNDFIDVKISDILTGFNPINIHTDFIQEVGEYRLTHSVNIINPRVQSPTYMDRSGKILMLTPDIARTRNFSYSGMLIVDLDITVISYDKELSTKQQYKYCLSNVEIGNIPIMVKSNKCILMDPNVEHIENDCLYDYGGYFIINGSEKVVINQERISENVVLVFKDTKSTSHKFLAEIRSVNNQLCSPPKLTTITMAAKPNNYGKYMVINNIHYIKCTDIPIFLVFRALGMVSDKEIVECIVQDPNSELGKTMTKSLMGSIHHVGNIHTRDAAKAYLKRYLSKNNHPLELMDSDVYREEYLNRVLTYDFLPHIGNNLHAKAIFLGAMVRQLLLTSYGIRPLDDRDSYVLKRVETTGALMSSLFRQHLGKLVKDFKLHIEKDLKVLEKKALEEQIKCINRFSVRRLIRCKTLDAGMKYALSTGTWGASISAKKTKMGVAQILNRLNYPSTLSHFRRVNTSIEKSGKVTKPRQLHCSQYGIICASESPEGGPIGLLKNLALSSSMTIKSNLNDLVKLLPTLGVNMDLELKNVKTFNVIVFVNSCPYGWTNKPQEVLAKLKGLKYTGQIDIRVSIYWDVLNNEIRVCGDAGRLVRPLLRVKDNHLMITKEIIHGLESGEYDWNHLLYPTKFPNIGFTESCIEMVDVQELCHVVIAQNINDIINNDVETPIVYTYMEIHPALIFGIIASNMSFANHNQSPRVTYSSAMMKQAIGSYHSKFNDRYDTVAHVLTYPQRPLSQSLFADTIKANQMPYGNNIIIAFAAFTGYNQEDSLIFNKTSVERGMFSSTVYKTYYDAIDSKSTNTSEYEEYGASHLLNKKMMASDQVINNDGFPTLNSYLKSNDVLFCKRIVRTNPDGEVEYINRSVYLKSNEDGFVDKVAYNNNHFINENSEGNKFGMVKISNHRGVTNGDKMAYGPQKGTVGMVLNQADLPHTENGMVPDCIANPNALPSRMTMGMLMEMMLSRNGSIVGKYGNSTPFSHNMTMGEIAASLAQNGRSPLCEETMYCPTTGKKLPCQIFTGIVYYQKLKHMVADKVHSRGMAGPTMELTRQSVSGRAKLGATRCGIMETASLTGMGTRAFLKERMVDSADNYMMFVCASCSSPEIFSNPEKGSYVCKVCVKATVVKEIRVPYCAKLLMQEMLGAGMATSIEV